MIGKSRTKMTDPVSKSQPAGKRTTFAAVLGQTNDEDEVEARVAAEPSDSNGSGDCKAAKEEEGQQLREHARGQWQLRRVCFGKWQTQRAGLKRYSGELFRIIPTSCPRASWRGWQPILAKGVSGGDKVPSFAVWRDRRFESRLGSCSCAKCARWTRTWSGSMGWRVQLRSKSTLGQADDEEKETAGTELNGGKGGRGKTDSARLWARRPLRPFEFDRARESLPRVP